MGGMGFYITHYQFISRWQDNPPLGQNPAHRLIRVESKIKHSCDDKNLLWKKPSYFTQGIQVDTFRHDWNYSACDKAVILSG